MARTLKFTVTDDCDGIKVYTYLKQILHFSTASVRKLKHTDGGILSNGNYIRTIDFLHTGDILTLCFPEEENAIPGADYAKLMIIYEDDDILVINKPAGLAIHPTHNHQGDTLANQVSAYLRDNNKNGLFRAVGRLDKCTSGLVLCALNRHASSVLSGHYEKAYLALVSGVLTGSGTINQPICRPDPNKTVRAVGEPGENAVTHWQAADTNGEYTLLKLSLETGRTHQIRVHCAYMGHPLLGDDMYGGNHAYLERAALHCAEIRFTHPVSGEPMAFFAPLPEDMQNLTKHLNYHYEEDFI